ncbi:MAG: AP2 domain-containing protein [Roseiflexaceae bacterium]|nr:AP2 domain-containing protein [Roseiflexaceae bacterium]
MFKPKSTRHKNITRVDHDKSRTHGYNVRIRWNGQHYHQFFGDQKHGDRLGALAAALEWRDATEKRIGKPRTEQPVIGMSSRNKSGAIGVLRCKKGGSEVFSVRWVVYGERSRVAATSFSIRKHGEKKAFKLAVRARQRGEQMRWRTPRIRREPPIQSAYQPWMPPV